MPFDGVKKIFNKDKEKPRSDGRVTVTLNKNRVAVESPDKISLFEAAQLLKIRRQRVWERVKRNEETGGKAGIKARRISGQYYVTLDEIKRYDDQRRKRMNKLFRFDK